MIVLSLNIIGLVVSTKDALARVVEPHRPNVILLQ